MAAIPAALSLAGSFIASAIPAIMTGFGMIPFGLGIPLALGAIGAMIGMASGYMSDGIVSPQAGGSGFGKRVLFGPEGAISFNNKDTIVAGTNLNYGMRMNDGVIAPKGAIRVNDYAEGEPAEANIVELGNDAAKVLAIAVNAGSKGLIGSLFGDEDPPPTKLAEETILSQTAGFGVAIMAMVPALTAGITAAMIAANAATALIPRPVMVLNPVLPVFETNPLLMMGSMFGGVTSAIGGLFGGQSKEEKPVTMSDVIDAISNIEINLDGKKVSTGVRVAGSFTKKG